MLSKGHKAKYDLKNTKLSVHGTEYLFLKSIVCNRGQMVAMGIGKLIKKVIM